MTAKEALYPWESPAAAIKFAHELSAIRTQAHNDSDWNAKNIGIERRITPLLDLLEESAPIAFVSFWKHKRRGEAISAVARSKSYQPSPRTDPTEFVCTTKGTHAGLIIKGSQPIPNCPRLPWLRQWSCDNLERLEKDPCWNTEERINGTKLRRSDEKIVPLKRQVAFTLGEFCKTRPVNDMAESHAGIDFILSIYLDEEQLRTYENRSGIFSFDQAETKDFIKSISSKLASGVCALIEIRKNRITEQMTSVSAEPETMSSALVKSISRVLPEQIPCKHVFLFLENPDGSISQEAHITGGNRPKNKLMPSELSALKDLIAFTFSEDGKGYRATYDDVALIDKSIIQAKGLAWGLLSKTNQMLIAQLRSDEEDFPLGYLVLCDRINDLARSNENGNTEIDDFFDWEDELYLNHMVHILDFIAGLYRSRERSIQRAMVLGHEILTPTTFIYESALRQQEVMAGTREMAKRMQEKEIEDIMVTSEYVTTLVESLTFLQPVANIAPAHRYDPDEVGLHHIVRDMKRICIPLARKNNVSIDRVIVGSFYVDLYVDERALSQVVLNLLVNSIKYHDGANKNKFKVNIEVEELTLKGLVETSEISSAIPDFVEALQKRGIQEGILITVSDYGIGIVGTNPQRIFEPGYRETANIKAGVFGAGIGLSVVRNILRDHGADIWVDSRSNPTQICIFLPDELRESGYTKLESWWRAEQK